MAKAKRVALYLRVSTAGQTTENQRRELKAVADRHGWQIAAEFNNEGHYRNQRTPQAARLRSASPGNRTSGVRSGGRLVGRSPRRPLQDLIAFLGELHAKGVDLYLHQQGLDTSTPAGKAMFQMMGVFAEFERAMIVERVKVGLMRARAQGRRLGRPSVPYAKERRVRSLLTKGTGILKTARTAGVGVSAVQRIRAAMRCAS
jgi:DNA invertase Pin-like site-specific DNA recombinase